jgi:alkanesulfonate monooxygenase SsuD/methylene tetrahydromethanopterin reductase-like flavin-dependent oxidoreductase (luciferase family)
VSETDEQAERDYAEHAEYFYNRCLHIYPGFADAPGYRTLRTVKAGLQSQFQRQAAAAATGQLKWKNFMEDGYIIGGSPETVTQKLLEAAQALRIGHLMVLLQFGSMPPELVRKNTELFAREVMPKLRHLWDDKYEDHWWINPLQERMVPGRSMVEPTGVPAGGGE